MSKNHSVTSVHTKSSSTKLLPNVSGPIRFRMTNAYMFVAVLQKNQEALACLIAALQVINEGNWNDRGVYYLAQNLLDLRAREDYTNMKRVIQIGILDFDLWKDENNPFFQQYVLWDKKNKRCFTDKVTVDVLSLKQIEKASREDHRSGLYQWAKVFKATTWEELRTLAKKNKVIAETAVTMASLSEQEKIRIECLRHEKFERDRINAISYATKTGLEQGLTQGKKLLLMEQIQKKLDKGQSVSQIADALEETSDTILQLIQELH